MESALQRCVEEPLFLIPPYRCPSSAQQSLAPVVWADSFLCFISLQIRSMTAWNGGFSPPRAGSGAAGLRYPCACCVQGEGNGLQPGDQGRRLSTACRGTTGDPAAGLVVVLRWLCGQPCAVATVSPAPPATSPAPHRGAFLWSCFPSQHEKISQGLNLINHRGLNLINKFRANPDFSG